MKTMKRVVDPSIKCPGHLFDSFRQIYGAIRKGYLVGGFNNLEKYESQWEGLSHISWKIIVMFETTNQVML